jgi:hypothetical protein
VRIGAEARNADETFELIAAGIGMVLLAAGNTLIYGRPGIVCHPVHGRSPSQLAVARRCDDRRTPVREFIDAYTAVVRGSQG